MIQNWSRIVLVTLFCLLAFTASASAECRSLSTRMRQSGHEFSGGAPPWSLAWRTCMGWGLPICSRDFGQPSLVR